MALRPYAQKSVYELEAIFNRSQDNIREIKILSHELGFRRTPKSRALSGKIATAIAAYSSEAKTEPAPASTVADHAANIDAERETPPNNTRSQAKQQAMYPLERPVEIAPLHSFSRPETRNDPCAILAAWTAIEALSPQSYKRPEDMVGGDRTKIALLANGPPWGAHARSKPKFNLYFEIILGAIALDKATDELVKLFGDNDERARFDGKRAALGSILVDKNGCVLESDAVGVSSFGWALRPAMKLDLCMLGNWPKAEPQLVRRLEQTVRRYDENGKPIPIDMDIISKAHDWLVEQFEVPRHLVERPSFALKIFRHFSSKGPQEPSFINSYFLEDIGDASSLIAQKRAGGGLQRYMGITQPDTTIDLLSSAKAIDHYVAPTMTPQARWPSQGGHSLVLLQQAAVNAARAELGDTAGLIGINGPPGTGKTTLLRDIVAGCVLDRATAMARFDKPQDAFSTTGEKIPTGTGAFLHFYKLDDRLKGHEIVIASSNNKAVENVSKELPLKSANGRADTMAYFRTISDAIANSGAADALDRGDERDAAPVDKVETWGLMAAALGNSRNRSLIRDRFWWDEDKGLRTYLKAARGFDVMLEVEKGGRIEKVMPRVVVEEQPATNDADIMAAWRKAKKRFLTIKKQVDVEIAAIEDARKKIAKLEQALLAHESLKATRSPMEAALHSAREQGEVCRAKYEQATGHAERDRILLDSHQASRPGFFSRLFGTQAWKLWVSEQQQFAAVFGQSSQAAQSAHTLLAQARERWTLALGALERLDKKLAASQKIVSTLDAAVATVRSRLGDRVIDTPFFMEADDAPRQLTVPWLPDDVQSKREEMFAAALDLQKAFIDANAKFLQNNIGILMSAMTVGALKSATHRALLPNLWSSFFMVVPAVSTTFASVRTMFGDLPAESIGWLLIDEAGQAVPQAAVGAIMRAKRSIVVGDPLQIPPVVSLPEKLNEQICAYFNVDTALWSAPVASAQTLADQASRFKSTFETALGEREVGLPLLVHRRCQNPMFNISNAIAYNDKMVHAVGARKPGPVGAALGPSRWIDVQGEAETKWCAAEGDMVLKMLRSLSAAGVASPDLFIITPFKIVEQEMRRLLINDGALMRSMGLDAYGWANHHVGTIHTFQGREADTVILLLGAPNADQQRARQWAASPPNIINVAVSRAKQNLYVIGSSSVWRSAGSSVQALHSALIQMP